MSTTLLWFRQDLRLSDHRALTETVARGDQVVCCFLYDQVTPGMHRIGGAGRWWLHHALTDLTQQLRARGGKLILREGDYVEELKKLIEETKATTLFFSRNYEPYMHAVEQQVHDEFSDQGIEVKRFTGNILFDPNLLHTKSGTPFKVFTPFWKNCLQQIPPGEPLPAPAKINFKRKPPRSDKLADWKLLPSKPNWAKGFDEWEISETRAHEQLEEFLATNVNVYRDKRNAPAVRGTSRLSPYLHFGQISPRQIWHATRHHVGVTRGENRGANTFLSEIGWREFSYHLLQQFPDLPRKEFRANFKKFPWRKNAKLLRAWQRGHTGFPIVDAGMRELWHTGWMHNRVRMIVGSLLVKDLLIPWQQGAAWFWDTLLDADLASNSASWQWISGCGADAAPYFRIFNPALQGQKFDTEGDYIRQWVPELANMPKKYIHEPSTAPDDVLQEAGVVLGKTYPKPIVDRKVARQRALDAFASIK